MKYIIFIYSNCLLYFIGAFLFWDFNYLSGIPDLFISQRFLILLFFLSVNSMMLVVIEEKTQGKEDTERKEIPL